jgi:mRNA interferase MazF
MAYQRGDIVLIPFPFTDLSASKTRPAVVVCSQLYQEVRSELLLAYVSSQVSKANPEIDVVIKEWSKAGLLKPSFVRPKLAAIDPTLIVHHAGHLSDEDMTAVDNSLRIALSL